jgi:phosphonate transport system substrate-binding protein
VHHLRVTFALLSTESAPEVVRRWAPILAQLEKDLGLKVKHVSATDHRGTIEALKFKKAELGWLGPKAYIEASTNNYANVEPIAQVQKANGSLGYRSCLIVHQDSDVFSPEDVVGTFAFNDPNSTSGYLVPSAFFLMEMGVDPKKHFSKVTFSGSHEASILAVANKKVEVASTNLPDLQQIVREGKVARSALRVIWVSKLIPNDPIVVRKDLPASLRTAIQESLVTMKARKPEPSRMAGLLRRLPTRRRREVSGNSRSQRDGQAAGRPEVGQPGAGAARDSDESILTGAILTPGKRGAT